MILDLDLYDTAHKNAESHLWADLKAEKLWSQVLESTKKGSHDTWKASNLQRRSF